MGGNQRTGAVTGLLPTYRKFRLAGLKKRMNPIDTISHNNVVIALIIRNDYYADGIVFITPKEFSQQLGYMNHPAGYKVQPHVHNPVSRVVTNTQEVLFIRKGRVKVDFYTSDQSYLDSRELSTGDVILLAGGGHGITMLEPTEMIEVKTGPYVGELDKTRFEPKG